ncbi:dUTP diphosphatase [Entomospira nematocerorum]|uniref:Deoxyuridine 5'-triphosphate nucleotidohydrolase n=2 Tax=Entomospira nematocerorum TaxID=2719987 RepID=A0A968KSF9_9SPIO|nr:dUTP diphosphatase [Entomospira nematocera]NIZ46411.1 dUTP diphosphatase [Entomospira nematocera]WDI34529.1 dUTP diphosphatase [Entomospira nematocera]
MLTSHPQIKVYYTGSDEFTPEYASELASGADLLANIIESVMLMPGERVLIPTGVCLDIPVGYEAQVRSRSGLAWKFGIVCLNSPGTIDADFRGEIQVILANMSQENFLISPGMRIAQLVFAPVVQVCFVSQNSLSSSHRGDNGFGSTGI